MVDVGNGSVSGSAPIYNGTIVVGTPDVGKHKICLQTLNNIITDEKCFTINVEGKTRPPIDTTKPHFLQPSPMPGSTIICVARQSCFITLFYTTGDTFGLAGTCPVLSQPGLATPGLHMFAAMYSKSACNSPLNYIAQQKDIGAVYQLCFRVSLPGKKGEDRCFNVQVKNSRQNIGPCSGGICVNGGRCVGNINKPSSASNCICPKGFSGPICSTVIGTTLQNKTTGLPGTRPPIFTDTAIPDRVVCYAGIECKIPLAVHWNKSSTNGPVVVFGHTDPGIYPGTPTVTPSQPSGSYTVVVPFTPDNGTIGIHKVCTQTKEPASKVNVDEICFNVDVLSAQNNSIGNPGNPGILPPTLNNNGTLTCKPNTPCHISTTYSKSANNTKCPVLIQTTATENVLSFPPKEQNRSCIVDTVLTPSSSQTGKTLPICLQPRSATESRCYNVKVTNTGSNPGLCNNLHCQNNGFCDHIKGKPVCVCKPGYSGSVCQNTTAVTYGTLPGVKGILPTNTSGSSFDNSSVIPRIVRCVANEICKIPVLFHGSISNPPILSHVDGSLKPFSTTVQTVKPPNTHLVVGSVNTTVGGKFCLQTLDSQTKTNIDEICIDIQVDNNSVPVDRTLPHFISPSLTNGSAVTCLSDQTCYIPVVTAPNQQGSCTPPSLCSSSTLSGLHVFQPPSHTSIGCATVVAVSPSKKSQQGNICISTGPGGEQRIISVDQKPSGGTSFGPCQTLHCENGGTCIHIKVNNKTNPQCVCLPDFTGTNCSDYITTTGSTTDAMTTTQSTDQTTTDLSTTSSSTTVPSSTSTPVSTSILTTSTSMPTTSTSMPTTLTSVSTTSTLMPTTSTSVPTTSTSMPTNTTSVPTTSTSMLTTSTSVPTTSTSMPPTTSATSISTTSTASTTVTTTGSSTALPLTTTIPSTPVTTSHSNIPSTVTTVTTSTAPPTTTSSAVPPTTSSSTTVSSTTPSTTTSGTLSTVTSASASLPTSTSLTTATSSSTMSPSNSLSTAVHTSSSLPSGASITRSPTTSSSTTITTTATHSKTSNTTLSSTTVSSASTAFTTNTPTSQPLSTTSFKIGSSSLSTTQLTTTAGTSVPISTVPTNTPSTTVTSPTSSTTITTKTTRTTVASSTSQATLTTSTSGTTSGHSSIGVSPTQGPALFTASTSNVNITSSYTGTCDMKEASEKARESVKLGQASCYCIVNGEKKQVIRRRPVASTSKLLKSAGIGAGGSIGTMAVVALVYIIISKIRASKKPALTGRPRPTSSPRSRAKVHPERRS